MLLLFLVVVTDAVVATHLVVVYLAVDHVIVSAAPQVALDVTVAVGATDSCYLCCYFFFVAFTNVVVV